MSIIHTFLTTGTMMLLLQLPVMPAAAQTSRDEVCADVRRSGGVYLVYPEPDEPVGGQPDPGTPPPPGYEPFYVSHYGRHGSRYLISDRDYRWVHDVLARADSAGALTALGCSVYARMQQLMPLVEGRGGDLSAVGERQQRGIASRMVRNYPAAFRGSRRVSARSTMSMRCAMSMAAFVEGLKSAAPLLQVHSEASEKYVRYLNHHSPQANRFTDSRHGPWVDEYHKFESRHTRPDRLVASLFGDSLYVVRNVSPAELMWGFYWIAADMQDIGCDLSFYDIFLPDELFDLWQVVNYRFYAGNANHADGHGLAPADAAPLLRNIIDSADEAIRSGDVAATLRFGHDGNVIPLLALMHIEQFDVSVSRPEDVSRVWSDFKAVPMAANVQLVFLRNGQGHVLVKVLHNEREVHIPVATDQWPYYDWERVRDYYATVLAHAEELTAAARR